MQYSSKKIEINPLILNFHPAQSRVYQTAVFKPNMINPNRVNFAGIYIYSYYIVPVNTEKATIYSFG